MLYCTNEAAMFRLVWSLVFYQRNMFYIQMDSHQLYWKKKPSEPKIIVHMKHFSVLIGPVKNTVYENILKT